jgi:hypothetical protein
VYVTARALGLEYNKLKRASAGVITRGCGEAGRPPKAKPMKFIEVTGVVPVSPGGCRESWLRYFGHGYKWISARA